MARLTPSGDGVRDDFYRSRSHLSEGRVLLRLALNSLPLGFQKIFCRLQLPLCARLSLVGTKEDIADRFAIYGPEFLDKCQRAAAYVDRILRGEKLVRSAIRPKRCSLNDRKSFVPLQLRVRRSMIGGNLHPRTAKIRMADRLLP